MDKVFLTPLSTAQGGLKKTAKILTVEAKTVKTKIMTPFRKKGSKVPFHGNFLKAYNSG